MKQLKTLTALTLAAVWLAAPLAALADKEKKDETVKPYPLDTCVVSDEKLGADPAMKTFVFTHEGQEIKLCCKGCQKTFNKSPEKYLKKIADAGKAKK